MDHAIFTSLDYINPLSSEKRLPDNKLWISRVTEVTYLLELKKSSKVVGSGCCSSYTLGEALSLTSELHRCSVHTLKSHYYRLKSLINEDSIKTIKDSDYLKTLIQSSAYEEFGI